ncbi:MAG: L-threonylcarbamoyladenylate synthase [Rickettsiales bacterium]|jgi:L-threonylcarbamoyladenylate synthase|nr:L-threonylcarbamoyladenylate synthase [Rickettsiales bacterium]
MVNEIIKILACNGLIAIPTDTIYGACGDPESKIAVEKLYDLKKRDKNKKLSILVKDYDEIDKICVMTDFVRNFVYNKLKNNTIILPKKNVNYLNLISDETIGIRVPNNEFLLNLLKAYDKPIFATSINITKEKECLYYDDVIKKFNKKFDFIIKNNTIPSNKSSNIYRIIDGIVERIR